MSKKILGLDLGTTSIGWAMVNEAENDKEKSSIIQLGVRVNPLSVDEQQNFEKGKSITTNADRTLKRSMRRNLQRYKLRRECLINLLMEKGFINSDTLLSENGNYTTFETYRLRAKAASEKITLEEFARVLLMINKKRGYKSSRKVKGTEEGALIDGMELAKKMYENNQTPGEHCFELIKQGKTAFPDFYRSDLQNEFNKIFETQAKFYPHIFDQNTKEELSGKKREAVWAICEKLYKENGVNLVGIKRQGKSEDQKRENFEWRVKGLNEKLNLEQIVIVFQQINTQLNSSSGYLGSISDRSKELYFSKQTVGQYQMSILEKNKNASLRNMVFYRQDYIDEFERIWEEQSKYYKLLSPDLKSEIRDIIIFYQRRLKSQKGLISFCEFESKKIEVVISGKPKIKTIGMRVTPRSSPYFQEFKIWQVLNNIEVFGNGNKSRKKTSRIDIENERIANERRYLYQEEKEILANELNLRPKLSKADILKLLFDNHKDLDLNIKEVQGNLTLASLYQAYIKIFEQLGNTINTKQNAQDVLRDLETLFNSLGLKPELVQPLSFEKIEHHAPYKLWHLLYSYEGDKSNTGNESLYRKLKNDYGFEKEAANILANISFPADYGSLSAKAIKKILPHLKNGNQFDVACEYAGYNHSKYSLTKEEIQNKKLKEKLEVLPKNSLRNPVVEKIINQMINVVNSIIDEYGKPDEIRIELARELKKNAKQREELTKSNTLNAKLHEEIKETLRNEFGLTNISRNDIIRYKLYSELKFNGYKTLYSNTYIEPNKLFSKEFDIEHIIPQSRLFDDSLSNKTLEVRQVNIEKGNKTASDYVREKYGETGNENSLDKYVKRVTELFDKGSIARTKLNKLLMFQSEIPEGFINRDLGNTQYIAKFAKGILEELVNYVVSTTGSITERLREDWQLVDVMKELNWDKYHALGLTEEYTTRDGKINKRIKDWTKRNDHRHHAMDALTVAFTKRQYIQYLNNLNAKSDKNSVIYAIEQNELVRNTNGKLLFKPPVDIKEFRVEAKKHLSNILISIKSKNKVVTSNVNITKRKGGVNKKIQLTPRGQLHLETIYGSQKQYVVKEEKVGGNFTEQIIHSVTKPAYRSALLKRLNEFNGDSKKAFTGANSLLKKPVYLDDAKTILLPDKVKTVSFETLYTIRKEITPELKLDKVVDIGIRAILEKRLKEYGGDPKKAFVNLAENPIWINKEKGIPIKRVTIAGISNAEALHHKRDKEGNIMLNLDGDKQPVNFVNTGNNHHVAVYIDKDGNLQDTVISFYEAVARRNTGLPIIDKNYMSNEGWQFLFSMKQNEYFIFPNEKSGFNPKEIDLMNPINYTLVSQNLYRVQKFSKVIYGNSAVRDYVFRHHLETMLVDKKEMRDITYKSIKSLPIFEKIVKVRINHIGKIIQVGE